jgi:outer membrane protein assembly factor BamB
MNRRQVLGALGVAAGGVAGLSTRTHLGPLSTWTPEPGTWPLGRYDLENTAGNPQAAPAADPSVEWRSDPTGNVSSLVADRTHVYVGVEYKSPDRVRALDRTTGETVWSTAIPGRELAVRGSRLYVAAFDGVWALDVATGETQWSASLFDFIEPTLLVTDDHLFVCDQRRVVAFDVATGERQWEFSGGPSAIADGALVTWDSAGELVRLAARRVSDRLTGAPPPVAWGVYLDRGGVPVVDDGQVLVGIESHMGAPGLSAVALDAGAVEWAFEPTTDTGRFSVGPPAVAADRGFVDRNYAESGGMNYQDLVAVSLADGSLDWEQAIDSELLSVIVAGETVLVATGVFDRGAQTTTTAGGVHAYSLTGERAWQFDLDTAVSRVIAVDDTIYLGTTDVDGPTPGRVYALA